MAGHACARGEACHDLRTQPHVALLLDERLGHGGGGAFDCHVVVNIDPGVFLRGICIGVDG
jgi:hypothetical protein